MNSVRFETFQVTSPQGDTILEVSPYREGMLEVMIFPIGPEDGATYFNMHIMQDDAIRLAEAIRDMMA